MEDKNLNVEDLVSLEKTDNSFKVLSKLIEGNVFDIDFENISKTDKKNISKFLYQKLCYYFDGFERLKSFRVIKDIFYNG